MWSNPTLAGSETEITRLQELVHKEKLTKRLIAFDRLYDSVDSGTDDSEGHLCS